MAYTAQIRLHHNQGSTSGAREIFMSDASRILLVDYDSLLSRLRYKILRRAGFQVSLARSLRRAVCVLKGTFEAVILSHTVPPNDRQFLERQLKQQSPDTKVMVLYARIDDLDVWADWFANGLGGPEALLVGLDLALARAAGSAG